MQELNCMCDYKVEAEAHGLLMNVDDPSDQGVMIRN